ncbi:uncharacterized protein LOC116774608 [Danaus plexippus]|uniref:uncharacterized protein LOC116774608 n=1 Tax=Danaus plexippus TaxID=13037 RepID=UPI002AB21CE1|nr:uncharacterized protein LOC116774608 [Danaus plexippus]
MSVILKCLFVLVCVLVPNGRLQQQPSTLPFPHLTDFKLSDIGKPVYKFEGLDYSQLPPNIFKSDFATCEEEFARCIRFTIHLNPVCGYFVPHGTLRGYEGICELDLSSCREMIRYKVPMYGTNYRQRLVYYLGEGFDCNTYVRRIAEGWIPSDIRDPPDNETSSELAPTADYDYYDTENQ